MAHAEGFEPSTHSLEDCCFYPLSYARNIVQAGLEPARLVSTGFRLTHPSTNRGFNQAIPVVSTDFTTERLISLFSILYKS